jgi:polyisoprenoid-binding protein YceI
MKKAFDWVSKRYFMKTILTLFILGFSASAYSQMKLNTENARVKFDYIDEKTEGELTGVKAQILLNTQEPAKSKIYGDVNVNTLTTGNKLRDKHLKSKDYFDAKSYPKMKFQSSEVTISNGTYRIKGIIQIKDISKEVTFDATFTEEELILATEIYAYDFDVAIKKKRERSKVEIKVIIPLN